MASNNAQVAATVYENSTPEQREQAFAAASAGAEQVGKVNSRDGGASAVGGAAVAGAVVGAVVVGPVTAVIAAGAAGYAAAIREDGVGDAARTVGKGTSQAIGEARDFNRNHHVLERAQAGMSSAVSGTIALNKQYQITSTLSSAASQAYTAARKFEQDHQVGQKVASAVNAAKEANARYHVTEKVSSAAEAGWKEVKTRVENGEKKNG